MSYLILAINPGSTSTKIALYRDEEELFNESAGHPAEELERFDHVNDQLSMRLKLVLECLKRHGFEPGILSAVMGRGGLLPPVKTGGYLVDSNMLRLILERKISPHASNLGAVLAYEIARAGGVNAYIYDAVSANEFPEAVRITGMPEIKRRSFYHVLNSRAAARKYAQSVGKAYESMRLIVAHLGGGITFGVHMHGKIIDSLADDNGAFGPERAGNVPLLEVIDMCYSGEYSKEEMIRKVRGRGGLRALLGTSDARAIEKMVAEKDEWAALVIDAQALQIAKGVALLSPHLGRDCDAIVLTGGLAFYGALVEKVKRQLEYLAPVVVMPGEYEMEALALGGLRILRGLEDANILSPSPHGLVV
ncbi:MAG: butyrate kinase [Oscillospiraceae bacterium]|jgi:butyrate kinase|nr:butyrate kinase [Oscillospiraceae bacterium]